MNQDQLTRLLQEVQTGQCSVDNAITRLKHLPSEAIQDACLDHHRCLRTGIPEVIYGASKTPEQISAIAATLLKQSSLLMATRVDADKAAAVQRLLPQVHYHPQARMLTANELKPAPESSCDTILIICAGTSDIPVAEEAKVTAETLGHAVQTLYDVGIAGLHRLLSHQHLLHTAAVIIVVAGMEGALPSVISGLTACPVIAVPTSVGYGTSFGGLAALLGMLNSCAPGLGVVNIDNGFGAACLAAAINRKT
ncbi:MAG: nickel pincer cofactor biosynthesis protein LarB [Proteobacteria bacterium]|nr:nickel pincer cofactor biosynthesis protein LarB [Pseudomonadota bacterium]MBU1647741.1 nickel pincer cofactor biosynthesis protein LarB [Pseudomonadota bacterium]MBU1986492.1 nickel pincer cofactor biosynthesis protein LarB [Pseudomonadota bacterium]